MDIQQARSITEGTGDLPVVRLVEIPALIRPYRVFAAYSLLYKLILEGELQSLRDKKGHVWVIGRADQIAESVMRRFQFCNGRWTPRTDRQRLHDRMQTTE